MLHTLDKISNVEDMNKTIVYHTSYYAMKTLANFLLVFSLLLGACTNIFAQAGTLDTDFGTNGLLSITFQGSDFDMYDMEVLPDGKILCYGKFYVASSSGYYPAVVRINGDGSGLDFSFGSNGVSVLTSEVFLANVYFAMCLDDQGRIYTAATTNSNISVFRLTADGTIDNTFNTTGLVELTGTYGSVADITTQSDGKLLVAFTTGNDYAVTRVNTNGSLDTGFGTNGVAVHSLAAIDRAYGMAIQTDGKILVCGSTDDGFGNIIGLIRMNSDGSLDSGFGSSGKVSKLINVSDYAYDVAIDTDGKIILAGRTNSGIFNQKGILARFHTDGGVDSTFGTNGLTELQLTGNADYFNALVLQPDGKILATGIHDINGTNTSFLIARFNADGNTDTGFGINSNGATTIPLNGVDLHGLAIGMDANGDVVIGGTHASDNAIRLAKVLTGLNVSVAEFEELESVNVFPNPAITSITLNCNKADHAIIEIYTTTGQLIRVYNVHSSTVHLNIEDLRNGLYYGIIHNSASRHSFTFVKR